MTRYSSREVPLVAAHSALPQCKGRGALHHGYLLTEVTDACLSHGEEQHEASLRAVRGYCRQRTTDQVVAELAPRSP